ncbi:hypothetical protein Dsin_013776 [Dipteronia sinensis]|uniref:Homeobox domain-containing protein n=1 Tax=Dipteronia sinensis TaxID=43782 RepID=A0AAE0AKJ3_9ROSI|nr:hypothetical protein Dsin_013776 [Dipteronia sinensis]
MVRSLHRAREEEEVDLIYVYSTVNEFWRSGQQLHHDNFCKEFPHPDDKQRNDLGAQLGMESRQIKFGFHNRRTQMKTHSEHHEHDKIRAENNMLKEAMRNLLCTTCGSLEEMTSGGGGGINFEIEQLRLENAQLKD